MANDNHSNVTVLMLMNIIHQTHSYLPCSRRASPPFD